MQVYKTEAIVVRCQDYRQTSQLVTFYTREHGKINILARGVYRPRNDLEGPFDLLQYCQIVYLSNLAKELNILSSSKIYDHFSHLHYDYNKSRFGMAVAEFLNELTSPEDRNPHLFDLALITLRKICGEEAELTLCLSVFLIHGLKLLGYFAHPKETFAHYRDILPEENSRAVVALTNNLLRAKTPLQHLKVSPAVAQTLLVVLSKYIARLLGHKLKVLSYEEDSINPLWLCGAR